MSPVDPPEMPHELIEAETAAVCARYRIDPEEARPILEKWFGSRPRLVARILAGYGKEDVTRLREYREVVREARKEIYYRLRRYQAGPELRSTLAAELARAVAQEDPPERVAEVVRELLSTHTSTRERLPYYPAFYRTLATLMERPPRTILDVGCGLHPLSYPFRDDRWCPDLYVALERDREAVAVLRHFQPSVHPARLVPVHADLQELDWRGLPAPESGPFELAFMLKLIPVVARRRRKLLPKLAEVPADKILITASTQAMTRKESIRRREDRVLQGFVADTRRPVLGTFEAGDEFGYLLGS